jgi:hypothetical protein
LGGILLPFPVHQADRYGAERVRLGLKRNRSQSTGVNHHENADSSGTRHLRLMTVITGVLYPVVVTADRPGGLRDRPAAV